MADLTLEVAESHALAPHQTGASRNEVKLRDAGDKPGHEFHGNQWDDQPIEYYHGTVINAIESIAKYGIKPGAGAGADALYPSIAKRWQIGDRAASVFVSTDYDEARTYAGRATSAQRIKQGLITKPVILEINVPLSAESQFVPDEASKESFTPDDELTAFRFKGTIPPEWISVIQQDQYGSIEEHTPIKEFKVPPGVVYQDMPRGAGAAGRTFYVVFHALDEAEPRAASLFDTSNAKHSGLLVSLHVDLATAKKLSVPGGEDPENMHITLCYCGDVDEVGDLNVARAIVAVNQIVKASAPLQGTTTELDSFDATEHSDDKNVIIARVDVPGIFELQRRLASALTAVDTPPRSNFTYTPHITLAYVASGDDIPVEDIPRLPLTFTEVRITIGDQTTDIPFGRAPRNLLGWMRYLLNRVAGDKEGHDFHGNQWTSHSGAPTLEEAGNDRINAWRLERTRTQADEVARRMDFDPAKIDVIDTAKPRQFYVGNLLFNEAGHYSPDTGRVQINAREVSLDESANPLVAHEITHDAFHQAYRQWSDPDNKDVPPDEVDSLRMFISNYAQELSKEDGVTDYSRSYWDVAHRMNPQSMDVGRWEPDTGGNVGGDVPANQVTGWVNQDTGEWRDQPPPPEKRVPTFDLDEDAPGYRSWSHAMNETFAEISSLDEQGGGRSVAHYTDDTGKKVSVPRVHPIWREAHDKLFAAYKAVNAQKKTKHG